jgi:hypothetical protein
MEDATHAQLSENIIFDAVHAVELGSGSIVEPRQVQHSVKSIKQKLVLQGNTVLFGRTSRMGNANHNLAGNRLALRGQIQRKRKNISRTRKMKELLMDKTHLFVIHQGKRKISQRNRKKRVRFAKVLTKERNEMGSQRGVKCKP